MALRFLSPDAFLIWHQAIRDAIASLIFQNIFLTNPRTEGFVFQRSIETAILRYQTLVSDSNTHFLRIKSIWNIKIELQEILDLLSKDPKSITREEVKDLLSRIDREPVKYIIHKFVILVSRE